MKAEKSLEKYFAHEDSREDPYGASMSAIADALRHSEKYQGAMSDGEYDIIKSIRAVAQKEDPHLKLH